MSMSGVTGTQRDSGGIHWMPPPHEEETTQRGRLKHSAQACHTRVTPMPALQPHLVEILP